MAEIDDVNEFMDKVETRGSDMLHSSGQSANPATNAPSPATPSIVGDACQWAVLSDNGFIPVGATRPALPPNSYKVHQNERGQLYLAVARIVTDKLLRLPDSAGDRVIDSIKKFWDSREKFLSKGQLFKRGILLWGPPGSGKTVTVMLLIQELIRRGGIVVIVHNPEWVQNILTSVRRIEPERQLICVMEDLDELISRYGESEILSLLDGENQVDNIVHLATTNYPERLDARLVNRPSRFDEVIKIGMPNDEARAVYIRSRLSLAELSEHELDRWVKDTEHMSIAHIRELVIAVFCLDREYEQTLLRLKRMAKPPNSKSNSTIGMVGAYAD